MDLALILAVAPFIILVASAVISEKIFAGRAGAAIPGILFGLTSFVVCWGAALGLIVYEVLQRYKM